MWVMGLSRSLKMAPIDTSYTTYYWSAIVTIARALIVEKRDRNAQVWRARERKPIMGVWGLCPQRGPGAEPLVRGVKG